MSSGSFLNKFRNTLYLSHHRLIHKNLIFTFYYLGSLGGVRYRVTILVCGSVCLSVPSQNNHLRVSWRLLVEECVPVIIKLFLFLNLIFLFGGRGGGSLFSAVLHQHTVDDE